jgi:hypothetical protein
MIVADPRIESNPSSSHSAKSRVSPGSAWRWASVRGPKLAYLTKPEDFDVMTEFGFPDRAAFLAWMAQLSGPEAGPELAADEAKFLDRSRTSAYVVDEHVTSR